MKKWLFLAVLAMAAAAVPAQVKTVPGPVMDWYKDMMGVMAAMKNDMDAVGGAPAAASAFDKASASIKAKNLAGRYHQLKAQYPDFFNGSSKDGKAFVPPPEWQKTASEYGQTMAGYGQSLQKIMPYMQDPAVEKAMETFQQALGEIGSGAGDD